MAAGVVMFASVMVLLTAVERLSSLRSLETRNGIEDLLAEPVVGRLGIGGQQRYYIARLDPTSDVRVGTRAPSRTCHPAVRSKPW